MRGFAFLAWVLVSAGVALAEEASPPPRSLASLSAPAREALSWLPAKCEALFVSPSFDLSVPTLQPESGKGPTMSLLQGYVFGEALVSLSKDGDPFDLTNKSAAWAIHARHGMEVVSNFGSIRYEGCTIYGLESLTAEDRQALTGWLAKHATSIESAANATVYKFPSGFVREGNVSAKPWEGVFVTWMNDALVVATSDDYLRELIGRAAQADRTLAVPTAVLDWSDVPPSAKVWGVRAYPADAERNRPEARTTFYAQDDAETRVVYRPTIPDGLAAAAQRWRPDRLFGDNEALRVKLEKSEGKILVTIPGGVPSAPEDTAQMIACFFDLNVSFDVRLEALRDDDQKDGAR